VAQDNSGDGFFQPVDNVIQEMSRSLADQAKAMSGSAGNLVAAAGTGFKLDPEAAATLIKGCRDALTELDHAAAIATALDAAPQLGTLAGAAQISGFTQQVATDDSGIVVAVHRLRATINQMMSAYQKASTNYQETEQMIADMLKSQTPAGGAQPNDGTSWSQ
jgi:hypothetical protein